VIQLRPQEKEPSVLLQFIFGFCLINGLPLHVRGTVAAAAFQRDDVIDNIARTAIRFFQILQLLFIAA
jgi:hypothetical protein